jgi:ribosomal protein S6--L-glutamate ligase
MTTSPLVFGWLEWAVLPDLGIPAIRAKVDSGARTSCLHADDIEEFEKDGEVWVRFLTRPVTRRPEIAVPCEARLHDKRSVISSNGHAEERCVIRTRLKIGRRVWPAEFTLTNRDTMRYRMLLGRSATAGRALVDPGESFLQKRLSYSVYRKGSDAR